MQLQTKNLTKRFDTLTAVDGLSFSMGKGEFVSVIGSSGAGKTTLFRLLSGGEDPDAGTVWIAGENFTTARGRKKRDIQKKIGMIYQDFCLVETVSCLQNVLHACLPEMHYLPALVGIFSSEKKKEAMGYLERVGLSDKWDTPVSNLSGGQKQRVAIARALMRHPEIILADEPVASLDPVTGRQILELLKELQAKDGVTILMNSHNLTYSMDYSDRLIGLKDGLLVYDGKVDGITEETLQKIYGEAMKDNSQDKAAGQGGTI